MLGFRRGHQSSEMVSTLRSVIEDLMEWRQPSALAQIDSARAYNIVMHTASNTWGTPAGHQHALASTKIIISPTADGAHSLCAFSSTKESQRLQC